MSKKKIDITGKKFERRTVLKCSKCKFVGDIQFFFKNNSKKTGHDNYCKKCRIIINKCDHKTYLSVIRDWQKKNKEKVYASSKKWAENNKEKLSAHKAVSVAIRSGKLTKKDCEVCGSKKVDAHHDDYTKKLDVRWLCRFHHKQLHLLVK